MQIIQITYEEYLSFIKDCTISFSRCEQKINHTYYHYTFYITDNNNFVFRLAKRGDTRVQYFYLIKAATPNIFPSSFSNELKYLSLNCFIDDMYFLKKEAGICS